MFRLSTALSKMYIAYTGRQREATLGRVQSLIDKYKPLMEHVVGVNLGQITARELRELGIEYLNGMYKDIVEPEHGFNRVTAVFFYHCVGVPLIKACAFWLDHTDTYKYYNSAIYVPFGWTKMVMGRRRLDQVVVHELSHRLWEVLAGQDSWSDEDDRFSRRGNLFEEGFASYCDEYLFSSLYPQGYKIDHKWDLPFHKKGRKMIEDLVKKYGEEILLRVPLEWKSIDAQLEA
ncbi:hypothetical protein HY637_00330 [Candidatus Woesearchaeota archaeon]|nr:hypothetical protein [Candidatus Woesearchaeota archaeon]